ncbi:class I SAM-dependent methyltransferase [Sporosarcina sp. BI001-red]|uniref:class I SAM-dependent methyltransferase n=1 Tax=Sporosarcina sp. BI001-red TaxID=2282866 RepID=UPI000E24B322|nr:class I SAM-dependent methyltransferase [Sporosarcina sp. BI001-red]REB07931.1 class I SAM-dependent methyltransferase [Sporosarcina sp. BI001-red]
MTEHYYSKNPDVKSEQKQWQTTLGGTSFVFVTDAGVFSKGEVDFGSRLLIDTFRAPEIEGDILDVGCGYGPVGLSVASLLKDRTIQMVDVNERALALTRTNSQKNNIENVSIYSSDALDEVETKEFASILTNPPIRAGKDTVFKIYRQASEHLAIGGELWVVIQKKQGAPSTITRLEELFGNAEIAAKSKGYYIIKSKKH